MDGITSSMDMSVSKLEELVMEGRPGMLESMGLQLDMAEQLNRTELIMQNSSNYGKYYSSYVIITLNIVMQRVDSLEKTLRLGGIGRRRTRGQQRLRWLDGSLT